MIPQIVFVAILSAMISPHSVTASLDAICEGIRFATFPHPDDCRQYVVCFQGKPNVQRCPNGHVFNPTVLFCVLESQFPCIEASTTGPPETPSTEPSTEPATDPSTVGPGCADRPTWESFFCQDDSRALVANPMNCTQYINCRSNPPRNQRCPPNTVYSDPYQDCLPGDERVCAMGTVDEGFCAGRPDGSYAHPSQCNRFISCVRQQVRHEACPPFFVFDSSVAHCVKGNAVACSSLLN
uniref:Chitin-binding type-2 domain-containing protein n=1 Tax=Anopheles atroparvus TaxID=41427 RepID=A0A182J0C1_ANOAO